MKKTIFGIFPLVIFLLMPISAYSACSVGDLRIEATNADFTRLESIIMLAEKFEALAKGQDEECVEALFLEFRGFYNRARMIYSTKIRIGQLCWPPQPDLREKERAPILSQIQKVGWILNDKNTPYSLDEDPEWLAARFAGILSASWIEYLQEKKIEDQTVRECNGVMMVSRDTLRDYIFFWEKFLEKYPGFTKRKVIEDTLARYRGAFAEERPGSDPGVLPPGK